MPSKQSLLIVLGAAGVLAVLCVAIRAVQLRRLSGTWIATHPSGKTPDVLDLSVARGKFRVEFVTTRAPMEGQIETVELELDGHPHAWRAPDGPSGMLEEGPIESYTAVQDRQSVTLTKKLVYPDSPFFQPGAQRTFWESERWVLEDGGQTLHLSGSGVDLRFHREGLGRSLFTEVPK